MSPCDGPEESRQAGQQGPVVRGFVPVRGGVGVVSGKGGVGGGCNGQDRRCSLPAVCCG